MQVVEGPGHIIAVVREPLGSEKSRVEQMLSDVANSSGFCKSILGDGAIGQNG